MKNQYKSVTEYHEHLIENIDLIISEKKSTVKHADPFLFVCSELTKEKSAVSEDATKLHIKAVINTTNLYDSHEDVHIPNLWKKTLQEKRKIYLLQEHTMKFDHVISRDVKASTEQIAWKSLGYKYEGETQALVFDANVTVKDNPYMFDLYKRGLVDQHSVGMQYVNLFLCINSEESWAKEYKDAWDKYISYVANKEQIKSGVFYAVTEAKLIEGSAVLLGSNPATPTIETEEIKTLNIDEPPTGTQTIKEPYILNTLYDACIKALK